MVHEKQYSYLFNDHNSVNIINLIYAPDLGTQDQPI